MKLNLLMCFAVFLINCKEPQRLDLAAEEIHSDEAAHDAMPKQLVLTEKESTMAGIRTERVQKGALAVSVNLPGEIVAEPDRMAQVSAATTGRLERVLFNEGTQVKKGELMAVVRVPDVGRLRGAFAASKAKATALRANAERLKALKINGMTSEQSVIDAVAESQALDAESSALGEQLLAIGAQSDGLGFSVNLRAPMSGVVIARDAILGQPIVPEHVLATIVDTSQVWFLARIFERDLHQVKVAAEASVKINAFADERFTGTVEYLGQHTDSTARTLTARIRLLNPAGALRLGLFGSAQVEVQGRVEKNSRLLITRGCVAEIAGASTVFVKAPDGHFVAHEVKLGASSMNKIEVLSGLSENEEVVSNGVFTLKSLMLKSTLAEEE